MSDESRSWRDKASPDRPGFGLGGLESGDSIDVSFLDDGTLKDTEHGEALAVGVVVHEVNGDIDTMGDNPESIQTVDENDEAEYSLMSSSKRLFYELDQLGGDLTGQRAEITAHNPSDSFERTYSVDPVD